MKTDTLFYKLLEAQPALLLHMAHLDSLVDVPYHFQSVELKEKAQRADGILLPDTEAGAGAIPDAPVIVCEVQFWADKLIYTRLVSETSLLLLQMPELTRFQMVLLLRSRSIDTGAGQWKSLCDDGVIHVVYLDEATEKEELFTTPEEQAAMLLMRMTVTPEHRPSDDEIISKLSARISQTKSLVLQKMFKDLFVSLYVSKYKTLTIQEVRAMIDTREIFDDIHESLAVQEYGQEQREEGKLEGKLEGVPKLLRLGLSVAQVADALDLPLDVVEGIHRHIA
ncbi:MAG: Rpn family recombination-promoting nuclease/putative transposase [Candidatus Kapabacteria bacterium]|jgi:predicted transposase/invertase (TIGR01784 family)|nr:Rpn family recombination-promoting nuclease/putative transposase [Candidatus Kapabacteria bacterium]